MANVAYQVLTLTLPEEQLRNDGCTYSQLHNSNTDCNECTSNNEMVYTYRCVVTVHVLPPLLLMDWPTLIVNPASSGTTLYSNCRRSLPGATLRPGRQQVMGAHVIGIPAAGDAVVY